MESACTPRSSQAWRTRLIERTPARWPKLAGRPWRRAQRPLPSMMIPTWRGTWESKGEERLPIGDAASLGEPHPPPAAGTSPQAGKSHLPMNGEERLRLDLHYL